MKYSKIKSFEDACQLLNIDPAHLPEVSMLPERHRLSIVAYYRIIIITEALNLNSDGSKWIPNWKDTNERKWFPWFYLGSGFDFSYTDCDLWLTDAYVGSRLCFKSEELAKYAANTFLNEFKNYIVLEAEKVDHVKVASTIESELLDKLKLLTEFAKKLSDEKGIEPADEHLISDCERAIKNATE